MRLRPPSARRLAQHPLVIVPGVAALLVAGWLHYTVKQVPVARPLGPNLLQEAGGTGDDGAVGWWAAATGGAEASFRAIEGTVSATALEVRVTRYPGGEVSLSSPPVPLPSERSFLYKAYTTGPAFTLLADFSYRDGSSRLIDLGNVPAHRTPVTVSAAFASGPDVTAVSLVHRLTSPGALVVDGAYLEATPHVVVDGQVPTDRNLLPNPALLPGRNGLPIGWYPYQSGWLDATPTYQQDPRGNYLQTVISGYRFGEAKWQYQPIPVTRGQYFQFTADYLSDLPVDLVAEFEGTTKGDRQFQNVATVPPTAAWISLTQRVEVPPGATAMLLTLVSHGDGRTAVRNLTLVDITKPGSRFWDRPLVSLTFDGDWQSQYTDAWPLLDRYGYRGTFYVNPETIETPRHLTARELNALAGSRSEIASLGSSYQDLTALPADDVDSRLRDSRRALDDAGFDVTDAAAPYGRTDPQVAWYAQWYYQTLRGSDSGVNTRQNFDPYSLRVFYVDSGTSLDDLAAALDQARSSNGWLVLVYGRIAPHGTGGPSDVSPPALARQLELISNSGVAVQPVAQALAELRQK